MPGPVNDFDGTEVHVLVTQTPIAGLASVLFTLEFAGPAVGWRQRFAAAHSRVTNTLELHAVAECDALPLDTYSCQQVHQGRTLMDPNRIYPVEDGDFFTINVMKPPRRQVPDEDSTATVSDTLSFEISQQSLEHIDEPAPASTDIIDHNELLQISMERTTTRGADLAKSLTSGYKEPDPKNTKVTLCLDAIVRPTAFAPKWNDQEAAVQVFDEPSWIEAISKCSEVQWAPLPEGLKVPTSTYKAMVFHDTFDWTVPFVQELYVDGSTTSTHAAWSVVSVFHNGTSRTFHGCFYGKVEINPHSPDWVGAITNDNISGELTAMLMAQLVALRLPQMPNCIRPDLNLSRLLSQSKCTCKSNPILAKLVQICGQWLGDSVPVLEIRGHQDDAWNDLADAIARHAAIYDDAVPLMELSAIHQLASSAEDHKWSWLQEEPQMQSAFPPLFEGTVFQFPPSKRRLAQQRQPPAKKVQPWKLQCTMLTANVLALETPKVQQNVGRLGGHRTVRLAAQWSQDGVAVAGIQEARTSQGRLNTEHYVILSSGCHSPTMPHYGCELWLHRNIPFLVKEQQALYLTQGRITVQHADPRRLLVTIELAQIHFGFLVLHAPCQKAAQQGQRPIDPIRDWWKETADLMRKIAAKTLLTVFIDANAPLASKTTNHYGQHGSEPTSEAGAVFEEFLDEFNLTVPSTFDYWHKGPTKTWTHSGGTKLRRDYILVNDNMVPFIQESRVSQNHDGIFGHEDHLPCILQCQGWLHLSAPDASLKWDPEAFLDPERIKAFQQALHSLPVPSWEVQIDDHCQIFEQQILQIGQQCFGPKGRKKSRPRLTPITLEMIRTKRQFLDYGRRSGEIHHEDFKLALKDFEKMVKQAVAHDVSSFYDDLLANLEEAGCLANSKVVYNILTRLGAKKAKRPPIKPLPLLRDQDGNPVQDYAAQQHLWLRQFAHQEAGMVMTYDNLQRMNRAGVSANPQDIAIETFPDPWSIQALLKKTKPGKVPGPDRMPSDLIRIGARPLAIHLQALFTKAMAHMREPLAWKGGKLHPLWKGKRDPSDITGYRSIFISNYAGKIYHQLIRQPLVQQWEITIEALQMGGRQQHGADMAHHFLQLHQSWTKSKAMPAGALFVDVQAAFYTLLRQSLVQCDDEGQAVAYAMQAAGISPQALQHTIDLAAQSPATKELSRHLQAIVKDLLNNTFFTLEGLDLCCRTSRGTRPGDPVADLLYNMVMTTILIDFRHSALEALADHGIVWCGSPAVCQDFAQHQDLPPAAFFGCHLCRRYSSDVSLPGQHYLGRDPENFGDLHGRCNVTQRSIDQFRPWQD